LLFTIVPTLELVLLVKLTQWTGSIIETIAIIIITGIAGAALAKFQGLQVLNTIKADLRRGILPGDSIVDGLIILVAATLLVTPGLLTDIVGLMLLIPFFRKPVREFVKRRFRDKINQGRIIYHQEEHFDDFNRK
jgi:UPF0716 protein FxsA